MLEPSMDTESTSPSPHDALESVSALAEPNRRALYDFVVEQQDWVSREQAAEAIGLRRGIAAHHLDRLAEDGLLDTDYQRLTGRTGPGAGRPAKMYRRSRAEIDVSLPPRRYDLAGKLLSVAADRSSLDGTPIITAVGDSARAAGREIGQHALDRLARDASNIPNGDAHGAVPSEMPDGTTQAASGQTPCAAKRRVLMEELQRTGYEPATCEDGVTVLQNCPFHQLADDHTELICHMNLHLLEGVVEVLDDVDMKPVLEPSPDMCCVRFHPVDSTR